MISGAFRPVYFILAPEFERNTGHKLVTITGGSMGTSPTAIPARLKRQEPADVVIVARPSLDALARDGLVVRGSEVDLVRSQIALAVRAGAAVPDIATEDGLKRALVGASKVAYSSSASGVYLENELFNRLGIGEQMASKGVKVMTGPVGDAVARGDADIGFQQLSELLPVRGITIVGTIPESVQRITVFSAAVVSGARAPAAATALIEFLSSTASWPVMREAGLQPVAR
jgi:molybdate transport system substrate-binding protein